MRQKSKHNFDPFLHFLDIDLIKTLAFLCNSQWNILIKINCL